MAKCPRCGNDVGPGAIACANCGTRLPHGIETPLSGRGAGISSDDSARKIPLLQGVIVTAIFWILTAFNLDGGWSARIFAYAVVIYAAGVGLILFRSFRSRDANPGMVDVLFVRWGSVIMFIVVLALNRVLSGG